MMPAFQIDLERRESAENLPTLDMAPPADQLHNNSALRKKRSEESISSELCDGPIEDTPAPQKPEKNSPTECTDRSELIERLKRGESPTWRPNRHFGAIWGQQPVTPTRSPKRSTADSPSLLPSATITPEKRSTDSADEARQREGLSIERPPSALHSGDFTHDESSEDAGVILDRQQARKGQDFDGVSESWLTIPSLKVTTRFPLESQRTSARGPDEILPSFSPLSSSISSSFIYKPPTSPLVQSESNDDVDLASPMDGIDINSSLSGNPHRNPLVSSYSNSYAIPYSPSPRQPTSLRQERTFPYQAHQPRRSLASTPNFPTTTSSPQTPTFFRSRRPSLGSEISPIQHASMVGSYEESILRGRMSTTPSKPLDFLAQIGVLGLGKCKSSLRCPPHVTLPFPAVFYSYANSSHGRSKIEDGPSPYVGQIDLENGLPNQEEEARSKRKMQSRVLDRKLEDDKTDTGSRPTEPLERDPHRAQRSKRRSSSPRAPPGGSYRIPEKGQVQIVIKNPNKTAVKLFLVPYDLAGMEPGTKTFIRQRSYSAGPIIDNMPETKDREATDKPILRYLVHLHICCPSKGRYYLYKSIRVVFANRVPDGKEKLRNEISLPEPRFTSYKPIRVMHPPTLAGSGPGASLASDKAFRRRSSGFYFNTPGQAYDSTGGISPNHTLHQPFLSNFAGHNVPVEPVPLRHGGMRNIVDEASNAGPADLLSPDSSQTSQPATQYSSDVSSWGEPDTQFDKYDKLAKGDVGYGGNAFARLINGNTGVAESLLSQRLRSLGVDSRIE
ncbi:uncharacterized protein F4812DRAFT_419687 [Daldinia caldariorum]|uniref:uncharacterized protein n=1 Tax=Daldinia caldariorum TaxID=326644 RepID=UPI002007232F|nr:uncharacterized protein F4812DRAFT_419687 [Daldinia caldariorum]KAI1470978.1 hypothetical protein F4812DRAFT_419687 [Daldinia caldariorum]